MESIVLHSRKELGRKQVILDCKFNLNLGKEVKKILSVQAKPIITSSACKDGQIVYGGKLEANLLYISQNDEKISLIAVSDFNESFENVDINSNCSPLLKCRLVDITTPSIKSNEVKVACIIDVNALLINKKEIQTNCDCENLVLKNASESICRLLYNVNETAELMHECKVQNSLNQVLNIGLNIAQKNCYCGNGYTVVEAECLMSMAYEDDDKNICTYKESFPFKYEIETRGTSSECLPQLTLNALNYLSKTTVTQEDKGNIIKFEIPIQISGEVYENTEIYFVEDLFSTSHQLQCEEEQFLSMSYIENKFFESACKGSVKISENNENIVLLGILAGNCEVTNQFHSGNQLTIEGIVSSTVLYKTIEEKTIDNKFIDESGDELTENNIVTIENINSVIAEFPFSFTIELAVFNELDNINTNCAIIDIDALYKNGEFEIVAKVAFWSLLSSEKQIKLLTNVKKGEKRESKDCAIEIVFAENNQNIWSLCKRFGINKEELMKFNPNLSDEIAQDTQVLIYNKYCK